MTAPVQPDPHNSVPSQVHHEEEELGFDLPPPARLTRIRAMALLFGAGVVLSAAFAVGYLPKRQAKQELLAGAERAEQRVLRVQVVTPKPMPGDRALSLPGSVQPLEETVVYPRASGYIRKWNFDIGDKVEEGAVLAEIDTPELDQQLLQARAQLVQADASLLQARATQSFSKTALERYKELTPKGVTSQQDLEQKEAQAKVDEANVKVALAGVEAQNANIRRLSQLKSFARVLAPFSGRINARTTERGALVSPSSPLFKISATDTVRVFVQVPQDVAPSVKIDVPAHVTVREFAGKTFEGKVARTAGALDPTLRTLNTEIRVPNPSGELLAGMYAQVALTLPSSRRVVELPATALMNDAQGLRVAIVGEDNRLKLVKVVMDRDTGANVELSEGLEGNERVVKLASAEMVDGRLVEIAP